MLHTLAMTALALWLLALEPESEGEAPSEAGWPGTLPLLALGPFLLLQALIFQNQGWISEVARISSPAAFIIVMLGNTLGLLGVAWGLRRQRLQSALAIPPRAYPGVAAASPPPRTPLFRLTAA